MAALRRAAAPASRSSACSSRAIRSVGEPTDAISSAGDPALALAAVLRAGQLHLRWTYDAATHTRAAIAELAERYIAQLRALAAGGTR